MGIHKIIQELQKGATQVSNLLQKRDVEYTKNSNSSGDTQLKVDVLADKLFGAILSEIGIKGFASEEREQAVMLKKGRQSNQDNDENILGKLLVAFDPLDGSSLVDSNLTIGSIFGIYKDEFKSQNLIASLYFLYGPRLEMVVANEGKSSHYIYNYITHSWEFIQDFSLKQSGNLNAPGGTQQYWAPYHKALIDSLFAQGYRLRYSGGMVPDLHQILIKGGGLFSYPATQDAPKGKLRKLFEVFPLAFVYECAGGKAIDGKNRLLELGVERIHDTTQCFFGSSEEIMQVIEAYKLANA